MLKDYSFISYVMFLCCLFSRLTYKQGARGAGRQIVFWFALIHVMALAFYVKSSHRFNLKTIVTLILAVHGICKMQEYDSITLTNPPSPPRQIHHPPPIPSSLSLIPLLRLIKRQLPKRPLIPQPRHGTSILRIRAFIPRQLNHIPTITTSSATVPKPRTGPLQIQIQIQI